MQLRFLASFSFCIAGGARTSKIPGAEEYSNPCVPDSTTCVRRQLCIASWFALRHSALPQVLCWRCYHSLRVQAVNTALPDMDCCWALSALVHSPERCCCLACEHSSPWMASLQLRSFYLLL